jgi:hypothetical protein
MSDSPRDVIGTVLPKSWSQTKRDELSDTIVDALWEAGLLADDITTVAVGDARLPVETVEAYGLTIKLDALGEASELSHPAGLVIFG